MHTAESNFSNFVIEYLGEMETKFENTLAYLSIYQGSRWVRIMKKTEVENLVTLPLSMLTYFFLVYNHSSIK